MCCGAASDLSRSLAQFNSPKFGVLAKREAVAEIVVLAADMDVASAAWRSIATARAGAFALSVQISDAMLARLTPERRTIIEPQPQSLVPPCAAA